MEDYSGYGDGEEEEEEIIKVVGKALTRKEEISCGIVPAVSIFVFGQCGFLFLHGRHIKTAGTLPPESAQPQKLCTANFSSGTLKTLINRRLRLKNKIF